MISVSWVLVAVMSVLLSWLVGWWLRRGGFDVVRHRPEDVVEAAVALLGLAAVALDPLGHQVEDLRFEVHRAALGVPAAAHQAGVLEHLEVLGDGLDGHVVRRGELVDGGVPDGQPGHHVAPGGVGQRREHPGERISRHACLLVFNHSVEHRLEFQNHRCQPVG